VGKGKRIKEIVCKVYWKCIGLPVYIVYCAMLGFIGKIVNGIDSIKLYFKTYYTFDK